MTLRPAPPRDEDELRLRVSALAGRTLGDVARAFGLVAPGGGVRTKGKVGELLERALGASGGSAAQHDFPGLGIELKSIPVDATGAPRESTFVCTIALADAERAEWELSWTRAKLSHVCWVPIVTKDGAPPESRVIGEAVFWRPTPAQERVLRDDFDELMGLVGVGGIESLTAHAGRWLQLRPKAASGRSRTVAFGADGERIETVPRGFYLRARFTGAILLDPAALPK